MQKFLLLCFMSISGITARAQSPTVVSNAANCVFFRDFNNSNEGFSSPSIYSNADDVAFNWDATAGVEIETSGLTVRSASLISPVYIQTIYGSATIGFRYAAPSGAEYRIRIVSAVIGSPLEVLATTANGPVWTPLPALAGNICLLLTDADLASGRQLRYEFTFRLNQPGNIIFDDLTQGPLNIPLPVTFMGFVARKNADGSIKLLWDVAEEVNVKGYSLEMSTDGISFTDAGYTPAAGKSIYSLDYSGLKTQTTFFRVRNIDFDGRSKYTPVIRVYNKEDANMFIQIYPMPANDQVTIQHKQAFGKSTIILSALDGRVLQQVGVTPFTLQTQLNIGNLTKGMYIVRYYDGNANLQTAKLIKN
jgi:Secretion system C-terminal sorting domain